MPDNQVERVHQPAFGDGKGKGQQQPRPVPKNPTKVEKTPPATSKPAPKSK